MKQPDEKNAESWADAAALKIISRISSPLMVLLCVWVLKNVYEANVNISTLTAAIEGKVNTLTVEVQSAQKNLDDEKENRGKLEQRFNSFMDAFATEEKTSKKNGGI